ncbi:MAG TPA: hypothetical protein VGN95_17930 [Pyrinomonadaceae bacterium]|nr:hypothetical protein [Pyrinomonadaceae bacterium]
MNKPLNRFFALTLLTLCCSQSLFAQNNPTQIPKEVKDAIGTYTGFWTSYGLDANGQVTKQVAWTDMVKAENPVVEKSRAFVTTTDEMIFEGGRIPPMTVSGKEGYFLNSNGSLGEYFIETYGQIYKMQKLGKNVFAYTVAAAPQELARLAAAKVQSAQHTLIKVITFEQGVETHNISRLTTVRWTDASGKERTTQFISLQGRHQRQRN